MKTNKLSISLYPWHIEIIDRYARELGIQGSNVRSPVLQRILSEWAVSRGYVAGTAATGEPGYRPIFPLPIGYPHLNYLTVALDKTQPVYVGTHIETVHATTQEQYTEHHFIMVTQPDFLNRVHYCRIPVIRLIYHNGIAFAPDYKEQLKKVEVFWRKIEEKLVGEGFTVLRGMVALPLGMILAEGEI